MPFHSHVIPALTLLRGASRGTGDPVAYKPKIHTIWPFEEEVWKVLP